MRNGGKERERERGISTYSHSFLLFL